LQAKQNDAKGSFHYGAGGGGGKYRQSIYLPQREKKDYDKGIGGSHYSCLMADGGMDGVAYANDSKIAWFSLNGLVNGLDHERNIFLMA
jgi:hypothetical protein